MSKWHWNVCVRCLRSTSEPVGCVKVTLECVSDVSGVRKNQWGVVYQMSREYVGTTVVFMPPEVGMSLPISAVLHAVHELASETICWRVPGATTASRTIRLCQAALEWPLEFCTIAGVCQAPPQCQTQQGCQTPLGCVGCHSSTLHTVTETFQTPL